MTETNAPLKEVRITVVHNGFLVELGLGRERGFIPDMYVFNTPGQLANWVLAQVWGLDGVLKSTQTP